MAKRKINELVLPYLGPILTPLARAKNLVIVGIIVCILTIIIVPLPAGVLDFFLAMSISISVLIILISIYVPKPTDLNTFPTLILIITLFRLALNIATTRMILTNGYQEAVQPGAVSHIIRAFGDFVVGGNIVIGVVVFCILVLINFMVVTKGSTRVSEVQARFKLDAMPGKQMAIDADLNSGLIDEATAKKRREEIVAEADFYGAMDGSSKFIKGDAIAGIIITIVNIIGGILIGWMSYNMNIKEAAHTFTLLTIGDGLVSQIPGLITSVATAIIITRTSKDDENFAVGSVKQLTADYRTLLIVGFILFMFALVPGLPGFILGFMALIFLALGYIIMQIQSGKLTLTQKKKPVAAGTRAQPMKKSEEEIIKEEERKIDDILKFEILELELGYGLIRLAESELTEKIRSMRRSIANSLGFLMPKIRIRDNLRLKPNEYNFKLKGVVIANSEIYPDKYMAMDSGEITQEIEGIPTKEPAFGADALWIDANQKDEATINGYFVIDPASVISTHISELIKSHAFELLTRQEVQGLLEKARKDFPIIVDECLKTLKDNTGIIQKVLKSLLKDKIPIKDLVSILEAITEAAEINFSIDFIVERVRAALARVITNLYIDERGFLNIYVLDAITTSKLLQLMKFDKASNTWNLLVNVQQTDSMINTLRGELERTAKTRIRPFLLVVQPELRLVLSQFCSKVGLNITVLSYAEMADGVNFKTEAAVNIPL